MLTLFFCASHSENSGVNAQSATPDTASKSEPGDWLTGKKLDEAILLSISVSWKEAPLKKRLTEFSRRQKIAVFVDRRVDPTMPINLGVTNVTWEQFLLALSKKYQLSFCRIGDVYYVGPGDWGTRLDIHQQDLSSFVSGNRTIRRTWQRRAPSSWVRLAEPREIIEELATDNRIELQNTDQIPHDLWSENALPGLTLIQRMLLLLVGFEKTVSISSDGKSARVGSFPVFENGHRKFTGIKSAKDVGKSMSSKFPDVEVTATSTTISAIGPVAEIHRLAELLIALRKPVQGVETYSLAKTRAARGVILVSLAQQSGRKFEYPREAQTTLAQIVTIDAQNQSLDDIISKVLTDTDWTFELSSEQLLIKRR